LPHRGSNLGLRRSILDRIKRAKFILVWILNDFLDLGARSAIDKALQRLALAGDIRRIDRNDPAARLVDVANGDTNLATANRSRETPQSIWQSDQVRRLSKNDGAAWVLRYRPPSVLLWGNRNQMFDVLGRYKH